MTPPRDPGRTRPRLNRDLILETCLALLERDGEGFTLAQLGEALDADPTAVYRHFATKDELLTAAADRVLGDVVPEAMDASDGWRATITEMCMRLRARHIANPALGGLARGGPPLGPNEHRLTEALLEVFVRAGLDDARAADAYHAVIELTLGSAAVDAVIAAVPADERAATYARWRGGYRGLDRATHPNSVALADRLYSGTADERFARSLSWLLDGIAGEVPET